MSDKTGIEWTDATWNPIRGCSRVSDGCRNCYAETVANRFKGPGQPYEGLIARGGQWNGKITVVDSVMDQPLRWRKPRRIFVNSMSDLFHENVPDEVIDRVFAVMAMAHWHTFQVLTKRPARMQQYMAGGWQARIPVFDLNSPQSEINTLVSRLSRPLPNVWLGVSVEDQATADERIPLLLQTPAAVRWISAEPLLGCGWLAPYLSIGCVLHKGPLSESGECDVCSGTGIWEGIGTPRATSAARLDWVVVGGESGPGARPMHPDWVRTLRDQCQAAGVPFFFKQWGEWIPVDRWPNDIRATAIRIDGSTVPIDVVPEDVGGHRMHRVGKRLAGRLLDGREWNEYPEPA